MNKLILISALLALGACGKMPEQGTSDSVGQNLPPIAPPIIPPDEATTPTEPPSYEVSIASAAAVRNKALERCAKQPEAVRTECEQEANGAFAKNETELQDLRGNKE